jgi:hypothetical protein
MKRVAATLFALALCGPALAQVVGSAANVQGLVTISNGQTLSNLQPGQPIPNGSTVITGSGSSAQLQIQAQDGTCSVSVGPASQLQVLASQTCSQLNGAVVASTAAPDSFFAANGSAIVAGATTLLNVGLVTRTKLSGE